MGFMQALRQHSSNIFVCPDHDKKSPHLQEKQFKIIAIISGILARIRGGGVIEGDVHGARSSAAMDEPRQLGTSNSMESYTIEVIPSAALDSPPPSPRGSNVEEDGYFTTRMEFTDDEDEEEEEEVKEEEEEKDEKEEDGMNLIKIPSNDEEENHNDDKNDDKEEEEEEKEEEGMTLLKLPDDDDQEENDKDNDDDEKQGNEEEEVAAMVVDKEEGIKLWNEVEEGDMEEELKLLLKKDNEQHILINEEDNEVWEEKKKANDKEEEEEEEEKGMNMLKLPNNDEDVVEEEVVVMEKEEYIKWWDEVDEGDMEEEVQLLITLMKEDGQHNLMDDIGDEEEGDKEKVKEVIEQLTLLDEDFNREEGDEKMEKKFKFIKWLGSGARGTVYQAELGGSGCYFAVKIMDKATLDQDGLTRAQTERMVLELVDHPFLPTFHSYFETESRIGLVMDFCSGGDLFRLREEQPGKHFSEDTTRFYTAEVLLAVEHLHAKGIIYRDLKPENVLICDDGHLMLTDFDLALVDPVVSSRAVEAFNTPFNLTAEPIVRSMSFVGTYEYLAPEMITDTFHGSSLDWWTFGIFLYDLLFGKTPFKGESEELTMDNVIRKELTFPDTPQSSEASKDLIRSLLVKEPQDRLGAKRGASEIKEHQFFQGMEWERLQFNRPPEVQRPFQKDTQADFGAVDMNSEGCEDMFNCF